MFNLQAKQLGTRLEKAIEELIRESTCREL